MRVYGRHVRAHLSDEEIVVNLMECVLHLVERDDNADTITIDVEDVKITLHVDFSGVQEELYEDR